MRSIITLALAALLAGCGTRPTWLDNRAACTLDGEQLHVLSVWGPFSIGTEIRREDAEVACRR